MISKKMIIMFGVIGLINPLYIVPKKQVSHPQTKEQLIAEIKGLIGQVEKEKLLQHDKQIKVIEKTVQGLSAHKKRTVTPSKLAETQDKLQEARDIVAIQGMEIKKLRQNIAMVHAANQQKDEELTKLKKQLDFVTRLNGRVTASIHRNQQRPLEKICTTGGKIYKSDLIEQFAYMQQENQALKDSHKKEIERNQQITSKNVEHVQELEQQIAHIEKTYQAMIETKNHEQKAMREKLADTQERLAHVQLIADTATSTAAQLTTARQQLATAQQAVCDLQNTLAKKELFIKETGNNHARELKTVRQELVVTRGKVDELEAIRQKTEQQLAELTSKVESTQKAMCDLRMKESAKEQISKLALIDSKS